MTSRTSKILVPLLLVGILGGGVGIGIAVDRMWLRAKSTKAEAKETKRRMRTRDPEKQATWLLGKFQKRLDLKEAQVAPVKQALRRMFTGLKTSRDTYRKDAKETRRQARAVIRKVLTPDQQKRFKEMVKRYEKRRADRRKRRRRRR